MIVLVLFGASGSGKTTIAQQICDEYEGTVVLNLDMFYKDIPKDRTLRLATLGLGDWGGYTTREEYINHYNFDDPGSLDWGLARSTIARLQAGETVTLKKYSFVEHHHTDEEIVIRPGPILLIEGIHAYKVRDLANLVVYVDTSLDFCLMRRIQRDMSPVDGRGRTFAQATEQWIRTVRPAFKKYIEPERKNVHLVIQNDGERADIDTSVLLSQIAGLQKKSVKKIY